MPTVVLEAEAEVALWRKLGICGCGEPEAVGEWVHEALRRIKAITEGWDANATDAQMEPLYRARDEHFRHDDKPVYYALWTWLDQSGLIEHGGGIGGSWLAEDGVRLLAFLDTPAGAIVKEGSASWDAETGKLLPPNDF